MQPTQLKSTTQGKLILLLAYQYVAKVTRGVGLRLKKGCFTITFLALDVYNKNEWNF